MQYEIAHRTSTDAPSEVLTVDAKRSAAAIQTAREQLPEGSRLLSVRPLSDDLRG